MTTTNNIKLSVSKWTIKVAENAAGELELTVLHPHNDSEQTVTICVNHQLVVVHAHHPSLGEDADAEKELQNSLITDWALNLAIEDMSVLKSMLQSAATDARFAQQMLQQLQGYSYEGRVPFGQLPYWRRNGSLCDAPKPVAHALAYDIIRERIVAKLGEHHLSAPRSYQQELGLTSWLDSLASSRTLAAAE